MKLKVQRMHQKTVLSSASRVSLISCACLDPKGGQDVDRTSQKHLRWDTSKSCKWSSKTRFLSTRFDFDNISSFWYVPISLLLCNFPIISFTSRSVSKVPYNFLMVSFTASILCIYTMYYNMYYYGIHGPISVY